MSEAGSNEIYHDPAKTIVHFESPTGTRYTIEEEPMVKTVVDSVLDWFPWRRKRARERCRAHHPAGRLRPAI